MQELESEIKNIIAEILEKDPEEIKPESRFIEDLGMDSMMALEILAAMEKKYKIAIPEEKLAALTNLNATLAIARECLAKKQNAHT
ncbi:MAG: acyl carrier protein [Candidatus Omnitrophica bacterium]|nr:acyl carrier protein [Candidatus Omnitrophota bacterium]MDD5610276.1 acyl carrier protein [Candidatus Omnitrophota bacterium]